MLSFERKKLYDGGAKAVDATPDPMIALAKLVDKEAREVRKVVETQSEIKQQAYAQLAKAKFAIESNTTAREAYRVQTGEVGLSLADPTAMAVALDRSIGLSWSRHRVAIESGSELTRGMTVVDQLDVATDFRNKGVWAEAAKRQRKVHVCWTLDIPRWKALLFSALS